jgi:small-conductance mechanosensitive channel
LNPPTLSNLFAGVHIIISRQVKPGDYIRLESGDEGYVSDITWRNTTIRDLSNNIVVVPNSKLASTIITNFNKPEKEMAVLVQMAAAYGSDLRKVENVAIEVGKEVMKDVPGGVPEFTPFIRYHTMGDFAVNFSVILRSREFTDQYLIKHEFIKRVLARYAAEGIKIPLPVRDVRITSGQK